jgi:hypothetical protein
MEAAMGCTLIALAARGAASGPLDVSTAIVSFVLALVLTAGVGWWAQHLTRARARRQRRTLAEATPAGGLH